MMAFLVLLNVKVVLKISEVVDAKVFHLLIGGRN